MGKIITVGVVILTVFTSCKRQYTCQCTSRNSNGEIVMSQPFTHKDTRKGAEITCTSREKTENGITTTCELKE